MAGTWGKFFVGLGGAELLQSAASHLFCGCDVFWNYALRSAEIPPAGAPSGFDSAAMVGFSVRLYMAMPLRSE